MSKEIPFEQLQPEVARGPIVKEQLLKRCCCFSLRTGCLIIGYLNIILTCIYLFLTLALTFTIKNHLAGDVQEATFIEHLNLTLGESQDLNEAGKVDDEETHGGWAGTPGNEVKQGLNIGFVIAIGLIIIISLAVIVFNILLLVGTYKQRPSFLTTYVVSSLIFAGLAVVGIAFELSSGKWTAVGMSQSISGIAFMVFSALVAFSYKQEILRNQRNVLPPPYSYEA